LYDGKLTATIIGKVRVDKNRKIFFLFSSGHNYFVGLGDLTVDTIVIY
jgi:hypothetical protein